MSSYETEQYMFQQAESEQNQANQVCTKELENLRRQSLIKKVKAGVMATLTGLAMSAGAMPKAEAQVSYLHKIGGLSLNDVSSYCQSRGYEYAEIIRNPAQYYVPRAGVYCHPTNGERQLADLNYSCKYKYSDNTAIYTRGPEGKGCYGE
jgi:hypothetical protein